jgi:FKBP-type peptidyl-prolyl cis-trans isomerase FklB
MSVLSRRAALLAFALVAAVPALSACGKHDQAQAQETPGSGVEAAKGRRFMDNNAKQPGVVSLPSGMQYKIVHSGPADGPHPHAGDEVKVHYEGTLLDGTVFDSTLAQGTPAVLELDTLVKGWKEALPLMRPGDEWLLYIPPKLGYGERGAGGVIPPNATLVFRMQLLGVLSHGNSALG